MNRLNFELDHYTTAVLLAIFLIFSSMITGCGSPQETATPKEVSSTPDPKINYSQDPKEITVEYRKEGKNLIQVFELTKDMPECSSSVDGKVAYVRSEDKFFECEEKRWLQVIMDEESTKDFKTSLPSASPSPSPSPTVAVQAPTSASQWYDAISGKRWVVGGKAPFRIAESACGATYRLPSRDEALAANLHGVKTAFPSLTLDSFWINELDLAASTTSVYILKFSPVVAIESALMTSEHQVLCIQSN